MKNDPKLIIKISIIIITVLCIGGYALYESRNLMEGPKITILEPKNGSTIKNQLATIKGETKNISYISLNDRQIFVDEQGIFQEKLLLSDGYNIIKLHVKDKFGREVEKMIELIYKEVIKNNNPQIGTSAQMITNSI